MKWKNILLIGALILFFNFSGLTWAQDNAQDNPNRKKSSPQSQSSQNTVVNKTQKGLDKAVVKTEQGVKKGANKTGNFFQRVGKKIKSWFD
ncbi:MAG: hypothetical protein EHM45_04520 [Desulfobacteraceae bacterium]|nr:MAG: hypothetical protein EHM45_04520 [Desulfobacteraceae bacterium]